MRLFLIQFADGSDDSLIKAVEELKKRGHEIIYWVSAKKPFPAPRFPETIFHDFRGALMGIPPENVDESEFVPPTKDLIEKLYKTESLALTMMNKHHGRLQVSERKHFYYQLLRYWNGVIKRYKPDVVIFPVVPHAVYDFVIYGLCKVLGIKTLMFFATQTSDRMLVYSDIEKGSIALKEAVNKNKSSNFLLEDIAPDLRDFYKSQTNKYFDATPPSIKNFKKEQSRQAVFYNRAGIISRSVKDFTIFQKLFSRLLNKLSYNMKKEYEAVERFPDFNKKFIYIPFQYQPEATTSPLADVFVDQRLLIETLSASIPDGWEIYVKEHPVQWARVGAAYSQHRYRGYYRSIAQLKNIRVVPINTDTHKLIERAQAIATNTGTAGWEAVLRLKPVLIFGNPWYKECHGILPVDGVHSCMDSIEKIINGFRPNKQQVINYLAVLDKISIHGYNDDYTKALSQISEEENTSYTFKTLITEIEK